MSLWSWLKEVLFPDDEERAGSDHHVSDPTEGALQAMKEEREEGWQYVVTRGGRGQVLEEKWEYEAPPDRYETNGFDHLRSHIQAMLGSHREIASLSVVSIGAERVFMLWKKGEDVSLTLCFDENS